MSWCRWSTNISKGITSDLYIYDDVNGGVTVHIAGRKRVSLVPIEKIPDEPEFPKEKQDGDSWIKPFMKARKKRDDFWDEKNEGKKWEWKPVSGDLKDFNTSDMDELIAWLKNAREVGVVFPDYIFEMAEESKAEYS